ncbi:MAG: Mur ligase family protein [bacterium]
MNENAKISDIKRIHVVGICGVATSALAIAFHKKGIKVTGSDKGFYPPVSTYLSDAGVPYYAGWHPEKLTELVQAGEKPDFIMTGGAGTSPSNPEFLFAKENNIPVYAWATVLNKFFIKNKSIVITGTWGKTSISSLLSYIMINAGLAPSYFSGGLSLSHPTGELTDSEWSVVEGDEYQTAIWDKKPKFAYYAPTHLLLTSVSWDHADLYPTEKEYFAAFEKLVSEIPEESKGGMILYCKDNEGAKKVLGGEEVRGTKKVVTYGKLDADYTYSNIKPSRNGLTFTITHNGKNYEIKTPMLGRFNVENVTACFAMAVEIGITPESVISSILKFKGIRRRLEKRLDGDENSKGAGKKVTVFDCHAPTPEKATSSLESIREVYDKKIIAIFEPNIGGRQRESISMYDNAFKDADIILIPHFTKVKIDPNEKDRPLEGDELAEYISKTHKDVRYIDDDEKIIEAAVSLVNEGDCLVFLGSHGFRGMIEDAVKKLEN